MLALNRNVWKQFYFGREARLRFSGGPIGHLPRAALCNGVNSGKPRACRCCTCIRSLSRPCGISASNCCAVCNETAGRRSLDQVARRQSLAAFRFAGPNSRHGCMRGSSMTSCMGNGRSSRRTPPLCGGKATEPRPPKPQGRSSLSRVDHAALFLALPRGRWPQPRSLAAVHSRGRGPLKRGRLAPGRPVVALRLPSRKTPLRRPPYSP